MTGHLIFNKIDKKYSYTFEKIIQIIRKKLDLKCVDFDDLSMKSLKYNLD